MSSVYELRSDCQYTAIPLLLKATAVRSVAASKQTTAQHCCYRHLYFTILSTKYKQCAAAVLK
jgi:hypothetical protein